MTASAPLYGRFRRGFLLALALGITLLFFAMIRPFLIAIVMAAILAGLTYPLYERMRESRWLHRRARRSMIASLVTLALVLILVLVPTLVLAGIVVNQAVDVSREVRPWVEQQLAEPARLERFLDRIPFLDRVSAYREPIVQKLGEVTAQLGQFLVRSLATATRGAVAFFFQLFIMLYAMFFFLVDGRVIKDRLLHFVPLPQADKDRMAGKFLSVARATLKGTLVIGIVQGVLAGAAFAVVGIKAAVFWGAVMAVLSIIPGVGTALVWVPAAIYLFASGQVVAGIGLTAWCGAIVGTADNFLRPWLVGKDTQMPDLLILLATLGGLILFGAVGIVIGPIVAALFLTVWDIVGAAFRDELERSPTG